MNQPDNQTVMVDAPRDLVAQAMGLKPVQPRTEVVTTPANPTIEANTGAAAAAAVSPTAANPVPAEGTAAPVADATAAPAADATAAAVAQAVAPPTADPYAAAIEAMLPGAVANVEWNEDGKNAFKATFGVEDPLAYKQKVEEQLTAAELLKQEHEKVAPLVQAFNGLTPALHKAFQLAMEGKAEEAQNFLKAMPTGVLMNKPAAEIPQRDLVEQHYPGKIKPEQWAMLNDPEADPDMVDALKTRIGLLHDAAAQKHDTDRNQIITSQAQQEAANKERYEKYNASVAATISLAKNSPIGVLLDNGTTERITSGGFLADFVEADGVTPKPEAATRYLYALHGEKLLQAAETRGYNRGKTEGTLAATQRQPSLPSTARRTGGDAPKNPTDQDRINQILMGALTSN